VGVAVVVGAGAAGCVAAEGDSGDSGRIGPVVGAGVGGGVSAEQALKAMVTVNAVARPVAVGRIRRFTRDTLATPALWREAYGRSLWTTSAPPAAPSWVPA
jgi:hypothetical protein